MNMLTAKEARILSKKWKGTSFFDLLNKIKKEATEYGDTQLKLIWYWDKMALFHKEKLEELGYKVEVNCDSRGRTTSVVISWKE